MFLETVFPILLPNIKSVGFTNSSINSEKTNKKDPRVLIYKFVTYKYSSDINTDLMEINVTILNRYSL